MAAEAAAAMAASHAGTGLPQAKQRKLQHLRSPEDVQRRQFSHPSFHQADISGVTVVNVPCPSCGPCSCLHVMSFYRLHYVEVEAISLRLFRNFYAQRIDVQAESFAELTRKSCLLVRLVRS